MSSGCVSILLLALFGAFASAQPFCATNMGLCGVGSTSFIENAPIALPAQITPATVQDTCNTVKTFVRPTVRQEVFDIPSVQRFIQTTSSPIVETLPYVGASAATIPTNYIANQGFLGGYGLGGAGLVGGYGFGGAGLVGGCGLGGAGLGGGYGLATSGCGVAY